MSTKIPCGGFELDDSLTLDSEKKLGVNLDKLGRSSDVVLHVYTDADGNYVVDKSFVDIFTAIEDGKNVSLYYPAKHEVFQLSDLVPSMIEFSRATPLNISGFSITDNNEVLYHYIDLEGSKNWLLSFDDNDYPTPVESLDYIKLKSPNGTLYTISVLDDGTIQAQANAEN